MTTRPAVGGILLFLLGLLLFACMDTSVKLLAVRYPIPMIGALRYLTHVLLMLVLLAPSQGRRLVRMARPPLVLLRGFCLAGATLFMGLALQRMPVAETTAIAFLSPLLVVLASGPLLREKVGAFEFAAAVVGFIGILLIARPGGALDPAGVAFALCTVGVMTGYQLLSRLLASTEQTIPLLFHSALVGSVVFGLTLPWFWHAPTATGDWLLFVLVGALGGGGHYLFTAAFRQAPASVLAPLTYVQLLWAGLLGWLVFGHVPDLPSALGMVIVAACGAAVGLRSRRAQRIAEATDMEP